MLLERPPSMIATRHLENAPKSGRRGEGLLTKSTVLLENVAGGAKPRHSRISAAPGQGP